MSLTKEAESLLLYQFSQAPKLKALVRALVEPFNIADEELQKLHHGRYIDQAYGATLDIIGSIVGQPRYGMSDENYRPWIKVAICLNNSAGTPENVLHILAILFGKKAPIRMEEYAPDYVTFTFFEYPKFPIATLFAIVSSAVPINTKCQFIRADPTSNASMTLKTTTSISAFRFDFTAFSASYFADFFEGVVS